MWFWLKISICMVHEGCWANCPTRVGTWKHRQSAEEYPQDGYNCPATLQRETAHSSHSSRGPCAQSGGQARKAPISMWDFAWNCHSPFRCAQDNSPWSPVQLLHTTSCSAVVWSQSHHSSHSLINNLVVCNKSCYWFFYKPYVNNK